ncbi:hypothetical protein [Shewanella sp. MBTL60-007]|uniref:hypothetical protein n=1 Tax=Shewanella sp. MBTL60-007 TaxID=2815911 RepID=UPI001BBAB6AA|nr:hypothetical protein [Shewanella sp. MBTL60-007]GIU13020.1 hypothetical protein TUM3792_02210 [Shewanella sp. MBTL60-007]
MSNKTVAIKITTNRGDRYFYGFGKGGSVQTAWSLAGAKLFLSAQVPAVITDALKDKKKKFSIVEISETSSNEKQDHVWMTREELNHYTAISKMSLANLGCIRQFALAQLQVSKDAEMISFWNNVNPESIPLYREDAFEWIQLARGLAREIKKQGGL